MGQTPTRRANLQWDLA